MRRSGQKSSGRGGSQTKRKSKKARKSQANRDRERNNQFWRSQDPELFKTISRVLDGQQRVHEMELPALPRTKQSKIILPRTVKDNSHLRQIVQQQPPMPVTKQAKLPFMSQKPIASSHVKAADPTCS